MKNAKKIQVMLVDDHFAVRVGLAASLKFAADMQVVAEASTGAEAIALYRDHRPDVVVMDWRLPGMSGVEAVKTIREEFSEVRVVMLSVYDGEEDIYRAIEAGACGYLLKSSERDELLAAIRTVHEGGRYLPAQVAQRLAQRMGRPQLSDRELQVLQLVVKGRANKEIASDLGIAEITAKQHVSHILEKLGVLDRTQAATAAIQRGIVHLD
jgi:two-component system NarL family response regulator